MMVRIRSTKSRQGLNRIVVVQTENFNHTHLLEHLTRPLGHSVHLHRGELLISS